MVKRLTGDGHGVQVVTGKAGTGKTFALDAARDAWEAEGHQQQAWEREALDDLREGRADEALAQYARHGRLVVGEGARTSAGAWSRTGGRRPRRVRWR